MRSPTGAEPVAVRTFGTPHDDTAVVTGDHWIDVPLDHAYAPVRSAFGSSAHPRISVYAREVRARDLADAEQPYLVFLQGGPGGRSPRPGVDAPGWMHWAPALSTSLSTNALCERRLSGVWTCSMTQNATCWRRYPCSSTGGRSKQRSRWRASMKTGPSTCLTRLEDTAS